MLTVGGYASGATQITVSAPITFTASGVIGNTFITATATPTGVVTGMIVSANGIPANTIVTSVSGTQINLNTTLTAAINSITFGFAPTMIAASTSAIGPAVYIASGTAGNNFITLTTTPIGFSAGYIVSGNGITVGTTITSIVGGDRKLTVNFSAPTSNGGAEITNYEHRFRGDALWTPRFPASTLGPIEITGLINGQSYEVEIRAANSAGSGDASTYVSGTPVGSATTPGSTPSTGTTPRAPGSPKTTTPSNTTSAPLVGDYTNAVPGITVTDPTVYRSAPKEVAGNSAIILLTPLQNKVLDIVSKTPSVCLPSDDDLVFIDEGKCIAEVVNAKTRNALRTLRTTVVKDDISELKVGNEVAVLSPLYFVAGSFEFKPQSLARLAKLKDRITSAGSVLVAGHSGILLGNTPENIKLASDRANAAVKELKARGAKGPFSIASVGALDPATTLKTQAAQDKNRRVVIVLIP